MNNGFSLNQAQQDAVETLSGPLLILAGAGTGKTRVIVERIVNLIRHGTDPEAILAVTFTNKAAKEMRERIVKRISEDKSLNFPYSERKLPLIRTFHALGVDIIRGNCKELGLPKHFSIYDRSDSKSAIKEALKTLGLDPKHNDPGKILGIISRAKGDMISLSDFAENNANSYTGKNVAIVWREYEKILARDKALDFDDLLVKCMELLQKPDLREHYQNKWRYIHIDEYQDTNQVQFDIAQVLAEKHHNICVVGDIDQNIYSWRGAKLRNILDFEKDYPEAKVIVLEENYRSTKTILDVANLIIEKNRYRKEKNLFTQNQTGQNITLFESLDEMEEAQYVSQKSQKLIAEGISPNEIAVLYRANFQSRALEEAFLAFGVPHQVLGVRFYERKEVKDVISYLRAALHGERNADFKRIVNVPARSIGKVSLLKILSGQEDTLPPKTRAAFANFEKVLRDIKEVSEKEKPSEVVKFAIRASGIEAELGGDDDGERLENVRELATLASRYDDLLGEEGMEKFLTDVSLLSDQDELDTPREGVKLMTIHAAKGLEFDYVFITGLEEGLFPHRRFDEAILDKEEAEEERRLCYVALTRARKKLFLTYAQTRALFGTRSVNIPSEFLIDIPENYLEKEIGEYRTIRKPLLDIDF